MTPEKIAEFKDRLEAELSQVKSELDTVGVQNPKNSSDWEAKETEMDVMNSPADENESADKLEEYTENRAINDELEVTFNNIKRALGKIEDGTYGVCEVSGEQIEEDRLEANPSARTCKEHMNEESRLA
jgi:RNA polymerase-binding transcription factor DksA